MLRSALRPRWLVGHLVVLALVVAMVNLGFWQLRRLDAKRDHNALLAARSAAPPVPVDALLGEVGVDGAAFRMATATGTWDADGEVLVRGRSRNGAPGYHVLTPLVRPDGPAVIVNRGWVPALVGDDWPDPEAAPPAGTVEVEGLVRASEQRGTLGPVDPAEGVLRIVSRVDLERLGRQLPYPLLPVHLQPTGPGDVVVDELPAAVPLPVLSEGSHLSYAGQWFLFSGIAAVGWVVLVRRSLRAPGSDPGQGPSDDSSSDGSGHGGDGPRPAATVPVG